MAHYIHLVTSMIICLIKMEFQLRNPTSSFKFATVESTNVYSYFKKHVEFQTMFRTMESDNTKTSDEAVAKVLSG